MSKNNDTHLKITFVLVLIFGFLLGSLIMALIADVRPNWFCTAAFKEIQSDNCENLVYDTSTKIVYQGNRAETYKPYLSPEGNFYIYCDFQIQELK